MMEAAPRAPLKVAKTDLLLEFLIVALDAPAHFGKIDEPAEVDGRRQRREPVFGRLGFMLGPFDQQPLPQQLSRVRLVMPDTNAHTCKARGQPVRQAFPPRGKPASHAHRICSSAISGLVLNPISEGTPAFFRRAWSLVQSFGR
jgi:hypothetical protein